jgi:hypothetical protein
MLARSAPLVPLGGKYGCRGQSGCLEQKGQEHEVQRRTYPSHSRSVLVNQRSNQANEPTVKAIRVPNLLLEFLIVDKWLGPEHGLGRKQTKKDDGSEQEHKRRAHKTDYCAAAWPRT